jgi:hypothetical protein
MADTGARLNAVIAALEKVREHIDGLDVTEPVELAVYNRWIAMLEGVVEGNWKALLLAGDDDITAGEMLMHVDAAVAFLDEHREA